MSQRIRTCYLGRTAHHGKSAGLGQAQHPVWQCFKCRGALSKVGSAHALHISLPSPSMHSATGATHQAVRHTGTHVPNWSVDRSFWHVAPPQQSAEVSQPNRLCAMHCRLRGTKGAEEFEQTAALWTTMQAACLARASDPSHTARVSKTGTASGTHRAAAAHRVGSIAPLALVTAIAAVVGGAAPK